MNYFQLSDDRYINFDAIECFVLFLYPFGDHRSATIYPSKSGISIGDYEKVKSVSEEFFVEFQTHPVSPIFSKYITDNDRIIYLNINKICSIVKTKDNTVICTESGMWFDAPSQTYDEVVEKAKNGAK